MVTKLLVLLLCVACEKPTEAIQQFSSTSSFQIIHEFTSPLTGSAEGTNPIGELVEYQGRLYGTLWQRGPNQDPVTKCNLTAVWDQDEQVLRCPGSVYSVQLDGGDFRIEHAFTQLDSTKKNADGYQPRAGLVLSEGRLYGTTWFGGPRGYGAAFSFVPGDLASFVVERTYGALTGATDGAYPMGRLVVAESSLYGVASKYGVEQDGGTLVRLGTAAPMHKLVKATEGGLPRDGLAYAQGKLHGVTQGGGPTTRGTYFTFDLTSSLFEVVDSFPNFTPHANGKDKTPNNALMVASDGNVYGQKAFGGASGTGIVFRLNTDGITILKEMDNMSLSTTPRFANATGAMPLGSLVEGPDGLLYGVTSYGGSEGTGTIFRVARDGSLFQTLYSFPSDTSGLFRRPYGGLIVGSDGAFYGTTHTGTTQGGDGGGGIFRFQPGGVCE